MSSHTQSLNPSSSNISLTIKVPYQQKCQAPSEFEKRKTTTEDIELKGDIDDNEAEEEEDAEEENSLFIWFVVLVGFLSQFIGLGITFACIGIMQDHLEQSQYGTGSKAVLQLSFVASVADSLLNLLSIVAQILLSKYGLKTVMFISGLLCTLGLELASLNTEIWHLIITIGVIFGSGSSVFFYASNVLIPQRLNKKQGIALGIISSGGCIGGITLPFIMTSLNDSFGARWCFRVLGFICFVIFTVAALLLQDKNKRQPQTKIKDIIDFSVLKNKNLLIWCMADNVIEAGFFVPMFFLPSHATSLGLSDTRSSILISLSFAVSGIGRIAAGHIGDRIGYINITIISCIVASLSAFLMWTLANDFGTLLAFACVYGSTSGVFQSLGPSITNVVEKEKFESAYTVFLILTAVSFYGLNVVAAIESPNFLTAKLFTGLTYFLGILILLYLKSRLSHQIFLSRL